MADGHYFEKCRNCLLSATVGPIGTKFVMATPIALLTVTVVYFENPIWRKADI